MIVKIHKEGKSIVLTFLVLLLAANAVVRYALPEAAVLHAVVLVASFLGIVGTALFFRNPSRELYLHGSAVIAPADGKVVVVEEVEEPEYFQDKRLQVSVFMSIKNVHVNRNPIGGQVKYFKYHPGRYLLAWHPKSSTSNERTTIVIENEDQIEVLVRQIAGKVARRIVSYLDEGDEVAQGSELGFIKFGSRVDLYLPLDAKIEVAIGQKVKGGKTVIAHLA
ncbi:MAG: phosphatidylserine decarboxylase family protein [Bacteroidetes bacterium]|nr:phosphatidylserine decarboxylase family protein [Bacteroidota bacterium]